MPPLIATTPLRISYIDPDGFTWNLSDTTMSLAAYPGPTISGSKALGGYCCSAISGIEGLPILMQTIPLLDGTSLPLVYLPQMGTIGLALIVSRPSSGDQNDYYDLLDKIVRAFYHRRNENPAPGTLVVQRPGGAAPRQIQVYTISGLTAPEVGVNNVTVYTLGLNTPDPYWSDQNPTQLHWPGVFGNPGIVFAPLSNPTSQLGITFPPDPPGTPTTAAPGISFNQFVDQSGNLTLTNWGDAACYPDWIITGPGQPTVKNLTSGRSWALNQAIPAGQQVQVTTRPGNKGVINLTTGLNIWSQLVFTGPHDLFPLMPGDNLISITISGATSATAVDVGFTNRYTRA